MELRDLANSEASAFIERLVAVAEDRARTAREEADQQIAAMRAQVDALRAELEGENARAATLEADLDAVIEAHRQVDSERIAAENGKSQEATARAKAEDEVRAARELLNRARAEATKISESLEEESTQRALLQEELQGVRIALKELEKAREVAEKKISTLDRRVTELEVIEMTLRGELKDALARAKASEAEAAAATQTMRDRFEADVRAARAEAEAIAGDRDVVRREAEVLRAEVASARSEAQGVRSEAEALRADADSNRSQAETMRKERDAAQRDRDAYQRERDAHRGERDALRAQVSTLERERESLRANSSGSSDEIRSLQEMVDASRQHHERQAALIKQLEARAREAEARAQSGDSSGSATFAAAAAAVEALGSTKTIADLFATMVREVGKQLPRVALFRVKGNHLEGEYGSGVDESVQLKKIVIPMSMDSLITRAANAETAVRADGKELASLRPPFGGSPVSAFAVPVTFQGETLAVLYIDSDAPTSNAHAAFAQLVARHGAALLTRLTQELKALKELRDYALMLLQEAEQMFVADVDSGRPAQESLRRLRDTVDCGRQLFAQRAALEGSEAAGVFDEQVSVVINAQASPFAEALAAATQDSKRAAS